MTDTIPTALLWPVIAFDQWLQSFMPPLASVAIWALISSVVSMGMYAKLAPQHRLAGLKDRQKALRKQMLTFDGEWDEAKKLVGENLSVSLRLIGLCIGPVLVATVPIVWIMFALYECYSEQVIFIPVGPDWIQNFDMYYLLLLIVFSIYIKIRFRII